MGRIRPEDIFEEEDLRLLRLVLRTFNGRVTRIWNQRKEMNHDDQ